MARAADLIQRRQRSEFICKFRIHIFIVLKLAGTAELTAYILFLPSQYQGDSPNCSQGMRIPSSPAI